MLINATIGVPLWQGVRAGMTADELKSVRPNVRHLSLSEYATLDYPKGCTYVDSQKIPLDLVDFNVCYALNDRGVRDVVLYANTLSNPIQSLKPFLVGRYGHPELEQCQEFFDNRKCDVVFRHGGVQIRVSTDGMRRVPSNSTEIHYQPIDDPEASF
jgi:hypothetical protein